MKVLIKNHIFAGGAARSLLQYAKILIDNGAVVIAAGEITSDGVVNNYKENGIRVYDIYAFYRRNFLKNIILLFKFYKLVFDERPDIIITTDDLNAAFCSLIGRCLNIKVIIVRAGGNDPASDGLLKTWNCNQIIVFSMENKDYFIRHNYDLNRIKLISNRIEANSDVHYEEFYQKLGNNDEKIVLLIISRLEEGKLNSILTTFNIVECLAKKINNIQLMVAGTGSSEGLIRNRAAKINNKFNNEIIKMLGHVDEIQDIIMKSHLVFGKGRSVIEPVMMNRLGVVVGEDNKFSICTLDSFDNLYKYNFAGRNIKINTEIGEIYELISKLIKNEYDFSNFLKVNALVRESFDSVHLREKLLPLIKPNNKEIYNIGFIKLRIIFNYIYINIILVSDYLKRRIIK